MAIIERYVARRVFTVTVIILSAASLMLVTAQILNRLDMLIRSTTALLTGLFLAFMVLPSIVNVMLPLALMIAACRVLADMGAESELVVMAAAGMSRLKSGLPVILLGLVLSGLCVLSSIYLEPWANRTQVTILNSTTINFIQTAVRTGTFINVEPNLTLRIGEYFAENKFGSVIIIDTRDEGSSRVYYSRIGQIITTDAASRLVLVDGELQIKGAKSEAASRVAFKTYVVDLETFQQAFTGSANKPRQRMTEDLITAVQTGSDQRALPDLITELNRRFTDWLYVLAFAMIAVLISAQPRSYRTSQAWDLSLAILVGLLVRGTGFLLVNQSGKSQVMLVLAYVWPVAAILTAAFLLLVRGERPPRSSGRMAGLAAATAAPVMVLLRRLGGGNAARTG